MPARTPYEQSIVDQMQAQGLAMPAMQPGTAPLMNDPGAPPPPPVAPAPDLQPKLLPSGPAVPHSQGIDPGVALANAGFTQMPQGVGAPLPPPPAPHGDALKEGGPVDAVFARPAQPAAPAMPMRPAGPAVPSAITKDRNAIDEAYKAEHAAVAENAAAEKSALEAQSTGQGLVSQHEDETAAKMEESRAQAEQAYADRQKQYDAFSKEAEAKSKVDPDHWAHEASTGQKIALILASALGGWSQAKGGGPNAGLAAINAAIDKDINAQRAAIEGRNKRLEDMKGPLAEALQRTKSMPEAVAMLRAQALKGVMARNATLAAGAQSEKVNAQASTLNAQLQKQQAEEKLQFDQAAARAAAAAAKGPNDKDVWKELREYSEAREKAGLEPIDQTVGDLDKIIASHPDGIPGSSMIARATSKIPLIGESLQTSDARRTNALVTSLAEATAHAMGQRSEELIMMNKHNIVGNGSPEDLKKGIQWAKATIAAREARMKAGYRPEVVEASDALTSTYRPQPQKVIPKTPIK